MPRQNDREHEGDIREYSVQISDDGTSWREIKRGQLVSTFDPQKIEFGSECFGKVHKDHFAQRLRPGQIDRPRRRRGHLHRPETAGR